MPTNPIEAKLDEAKELISKQAESLVDIANEHNADVSAAQHHNVALFSIVVELHHLLFGRAGDLPATAAATAETPVFEPEPVESTGEATDLAETGEAVETEAAEPEGQTLPPLGEANAGSEAD